MRIQNSNSESFQIANDLGDLLSFQVLEGRHLASTLLDLFSYCLFARRPACAGELGVFENPFQSWTDFRLGAIVEVANSTIRHEKILALWRGLLVFELRENPFSRASREGEVAFQDDAVIFAHQTKGPLSLLPFESEIHCDFVLFLYHSVDNEIPIKLLPFQFAR